MLYKHVYEQLSVTLKETLTQNKQLEELIDSLREENSRYTNLFKNLKASAFKDHKHLINEFYNTNQRTKEDYLDINKKLSLSDQDTNISEAKDKTLTNKNLEEIEEQGELESENENDDDYSYSLYSPIAVNFPQKITGAKGFNDTYGIVPALDLSKTNNTNYKLEKKEQPKGKTPRITKKLMSIENEEWRVALKHASISIEDINRMSRNKLLNKVFDVMINLNRIVEEKNHLLQCTFNKLKILNEEKNKKEQENIELFKKLIAMRNEVEKLLDDKKNSKDKHYKKTNDSSMIVNEGNIIESPNNLSDYSDESSEKERNLLTEINDLHTSMVKENDDIKDFLQTEAFENKDKDSKN